MEALSVAAGWASTVETLWVIVVKGRPCGKVTVSKYNKVTKRGENARRASR